MHKNNVDRTQSNEREFIV